MSRLNKFNDTEVYILRRQAAESSAEIMMGNNYNASEQKVHAALLIELEAEDKNRYDGKEDIVKDRFQGFSLSELNVMEACFLTTSKKGATSLMREVAKEIKSR